MDQRVATTAPAARPNLSAQERKLAESREAMEKAAAKGDPEAQMMLAILLMEGSGYAAAPERGLALLVEAAQSGYAPALMRLADLKAQNEDAIEEAAALWTEAARRGSPAAMFALGQAFSAGKGAPRDPGAARARFEEAARLGFAPAMHEYGVRLAEGEGGSADPIEAFAWIYASFVLDQDSMARENAMDLAASLAPKQLARARKRGAALACLYARDRRG